MSKIRIGIVGYGNLGRGAELAIRQNPDMELVCVFTRRNPSDLKILTDNVPVYSINDITTSVQLTALILMLKFLNIMLQSMLLQRKAAM